MTVTPAFILGFALVALGALAFILCAVLIVLEA